MHGIEGIILAAEYAREKKIPFLGICLGLQMAIVGFARQVLGMADANSTEFDPGTAHPVIDLMPEQQGVTDLGGTMRLGAWPCVLKPDTLAARLYGTEQISERHRHRYEVNNDFRTMLEFYIATQAHPEFKSRPNRAHPLFRGLIEAALIRHGAAEA